jgi:uncharacterized membrane protein YgaE (UPF0421/DUF939 family)
MKGSPIRRVPSESVSGAAKAAAKRQAEQLTLVRRRAQPAAVYITRMTLTAVFAYLLASQLPGGSVRSVLAPLTALLVVQATLFHTIRSAVQRVIGVTAGVLAAVAVSAYIPFSWWVLGLLVAGTLALGLMLRLHEDTLEVPISAMLIFSVDSHAAATSRITETLIGAAAGLAAGLLFAPLRVQPAKDAIGELSRQMGDLLGQMADGLAEGPDPRRAAEWLDRTRALRGEIERVDDALSQAEESVRLNPRRLRYPNHPNPAAGLRDGVDTLERAATDLRVLARAVADSARLDSEDSPVKDPETRTRLAAVIAELAASVRAYGQLIETDPEPLDAPDAQAEPIAVVLEDHLEEAQRKQDRLADVLATDPAKQPDGWPLRGEILAHVDRLRSELEPRRPTPPDEKRGAVRMLHHRSRTAPPRRGYRTVLRSRAGRAVLRSRAGRTAERVRARLRALAAVVDGLDVVAVGIAQEDAVVAGVVFRPFAGRVQHLCPGRHGGLVHRVDRGPVGRAEGDVQFPGLVPGRRAQPEVGYAVGAGQADDEAVAVGEAHRLAHPDRGEGAQVEVEGGLDVASLQADVIEHGWSLTTRYDTLPW